MFTLSLSHEPLDEELEEEDELSASAMHVIGDDEDDDVDLDVDKKEASDENFSEDGLPRNGLDELAEMEKELDEPPLELDEEE